MIRLKHMKKTYDRFTTHPNRVLDDISLEFPDHGFVCILGPSGCGKTTLLNVIGGLDKFDKGQITVADVTSKRYGTKAMEQERNRRFGYIFQNYYLLMERSVTHNVYLGLHSMKLSRKEKLERVKAALESVEMLPYARKNVKDLSGGQQQRVAIARALVREPEVIFADEPTGNLDEINTDNICNLLKKLSEEHLVIMVTHEERIAEEYADRVIRLAQGKIVEDTLKENVSEESTDKEHADRKRVEKDSADTENAPELKESVVQTTEKERKSGKEPAFRHVLTELRNLLTEKGKRSMALKACLILLTAMLVLTTGDYLTIAQIDPEEFIYSDSHVIQVEILREGMATTSFPEMLELVRKYIEHVGNADGEMTVMPLFTGMFSYTYESFLQMDSLKETITGCSVIPLGKLDERSLIHGRMPENMQEVVVDRWVLEAFMEDGSILGAGIGDVTHFLGQELLVEKKGVALTVVGICDSKEPSVYMDTFMQYTISSGTVPVMSLEQLRQMYPGKYDHVVLEEGEVMVSKGVNARFPVGNYYHASTDLKYLITAVVEDDIPVDIVVNKSEYETLLADTNSRMKSFLVYTDEKKVVKEQMAELPEELRGKIQVEISDPYTTAMERYTTAAKERVNARMIVTVTVLLITVVMLFIMQKARMDERKEMLGVYRLLGISSGRVYLIFILEALCQSITSALPASTVVWGIITALNMIPEISFGMVLPLYAAATAYVIALTVHLIASLRPVRKLLKMPPAVLAGMYDF